MCMHRPFECESSNKLIVYNFFLLGVFLSVVCEIDIRRYFIFFDCMLGGSVGVKILLR